MTSIMLTIVLQSNELHCITRLLKLRLSLEFNNKHSKLNTEYSIFFHKNTTGLTLKSSSNSGGPPK